MASTKLRTAMAGPQDELKVDMSPLIDMVFLLLIFFLVNATMIIVELDPEVDPPIARHSDPAEDAKGRIVVNIRKDGEFYTEKGMLLTDEDMIFELVENEKKLNEAKGYESKLHLRGHKDAVFKHCRKVIRTSARAGVDQVIFAVYMVD
jgi:biopolymer transport protein ExbD